MATTKTTLQLLVLLVSATAQLSSGRVVHMQQSQSKWIASRSQSVPDYEYSQLPLNPAQPRNIHLSLGRDEYHMVATWSSRVETPAAVGEIRNSDGRLIQRVHATSSKFVDGGAAHATQWIHRATFANLSSSTSYTYRVGSEVSWSSWFPFKTTPAADAAVRLVAFGDLGLENAQSLPRLLDDAKRGLYDALLHVGDFAYDMHDRNGSVGDEFMQMIQPIAATLPYMTCVGNHEYMYNFSQYKNRFSMPVAGGDGSSMFFSFNIGPAHIISISTEFYFYVQYGWEQMRTQYNWLVNDLKAASANRKQRPWIIVIGHRPMYCSNTNGPDCYWGSLTMREGFLAKFFPLEQLLVQHGVDLALWAHEHTYERTWPMNRLRVANGSTDRPYTNPQGVVHVITGSAGCKERHDLFGQDPWYFSAFRSADYGYTRLHIHNSTHLTVQQVSDDQAGKVIDHFTIVQNRHAAFV